MSIGKALLTSALILATSVCTVRADCRTVAGAAALPDGTLLFRTNGNWRPIGELNSVIADNRPRVVNFAYVANEPNLGVFRRGIVVIKTGAPARSEARVTLAREAFTKGEQCEAYPRFAGGSVRARSYDRYHDYGDRVERNDQQMIESFHVNYPARVRGCKRSNDDTTDSYFTGRWQSNISQFSFDANVVANGTYSQFLAQFGPTPVFAATRLERRVEMQRYTADQSGLACVLFSAALEPGAFVRINDLERRIGLFRAAEQSWDWPR